jgi:hypothetical protein
MKQIFLLSIIIGVMNFGTLKGQEKSELMFAKSYFNELDSLCAIDNGDMWGINLYGASMFIFPASRVIIANEPDNEGELVLKNGVYIGKLPDNINIANTSFDWNGKSWTMVSWEAISKNDKYSRDKLLIHESFHRNQDNIGIKPAMTENTHLDELQGSILLKLEFIALSHALTSEQNLDRTKHLTNALKIRNYRQAIYPNNNENIFEIHEGMPEYTGFKLCGMDKKLLPKVVAKQLQVSMDKEGLANSFPYLTGPAYGLIIDELSENWLEHVVNGKSLPEISTQLIESDIPTDTAMLKLEVAKIIDQYDANSLVKKETEKFEQQKQLISEYKEKFIEGDLLIITNDNLQFRFNPQEKLTPLEPGVVYKTMRISGKWGIAEIRNGILRSNDWQYFLLPAPVSNKSGKIIETDYDLLLNDGWEVVMIREGKYTIKKN